MTGLGDPISITGGSRANLTHESRHIIGFQGLSRMQGCPDGSLVAAHNYTLFRGDVAIHPESHWAQVRTMFVADDLADFVFKKEEIRMSYNDASLPMGGYHDGNLTPRGKHQTHRTGKDIDINANRMGYDCTNTAADADQYIDKAFKLLHEAKSIVPHTTAKFPNLDCYRSGNMRIDAIKGF